MDPVVTVYGAASALSCLPLALLILLANYKSEGKARVNNAHWVTVKGSRHVRNATERELWEHNNPGKSWDRHQEARRKGCLISLVPFGLLLPLMASYIMCGGRWVTEARSGIGPVWAAYAVLLSAAALCAEGALAYLRLDTMNLYSIKEKPLLIGLEVLNIAAAGLGLLYMLVFGLSCGFLGMRSRMPDSGLFRFFGKSFLWVCAGAGILLLLDALAAGISLALDKARERREAPARQERARARQQAEDRAKDTVAEFVMNLAKDPDYACPLCKKPFRTIGSNTVVLLGGLAPVCEKCYSPPIIGEDDSVWIDVAKVKALADSIRSQMKQ